MQLDAKSLAKFVARPERRDSPEGQGFLAHAVAAWTIVIAVRHKLYVRWEIIGAVKDLVTSLWIVNIAPAVATIGIIIGSFSNWAACAMPNQAITVSRAAMLPQLLCSAGNRNPRK